MSTVGCSPKGIAVYSNTASTLDQNMPGQAKLRCTDAAPVVKIGLYRIEAVWSRIPSTDHLPIHPQSGIDFA
jgi:hypothetical protein